MQFVTRELLTWPRPITKNRRNAPYSLSYDRTLNALERELSAIGVSGDVVIQIDLAMEFIRRDGLPYADARPRTPRVAIAFSSRHGPLSYFCDRFFQWQGNVRAIGLGLERLRLVEETGIVSRGEQYTGFKALPAAIELNGSMTVDEAALFIARNAPSAGSHKNEAQNILRHKSAFDLDWRAAARRLHPDAGGLPDDWHKLQQAAEILEKHHANRRQ